jgi:transposase
MGKENRDADQPEPGTAAAIRASRPRLVESVPQPVKRMYTAEFKLRILEEVDRLGASGERGSQVAFLRREGLTWTHVHRWRRQLETGGVEGLEPKKRGPKPKTDPATKELERLRRQNERLQVQLRKAEIIIDVQKKLAALLGVEVPASPEEEEP